MLMQSLRASKGGRRSDAQISRFTIQLDRHLLLNSIEGEKYEINIFYAERS